MNELIKITTNENNERLVDARELHGGLASKKDFSSWIKAKVVSNIYFEENVDWILLPQSGEQVSHGGHNRIDYALTIDTAKKVAMSEQTDKGNEVRDYFLGCERKLQEVQKVLPSNYIDALKHLIISEEEKQKAIAENKVLQIENDEMKPKADFYDDVAGSKDAIELGKVAKVIGIKGMGRNNLFAFLRDKKVLMDKNIPYQKHVDSGYFRVIEQEYSKPDGSNHINIKTLVYQKGVDFILKLLRERAE